MHHVEQFGDIGRAEIREASVLDGLQDASAGGVAVRGMSPAAALP